MDAAWRPGHLPPGGSRKTAQTNVETETFVGEPVRVTVKRLDGGPDLVIEGAQRLAERFFRLDPSAVGALSYDAATLTTAKDRFEDVDITTLNRTMAARTGHSRWPDLLGADPSPILAALSHGWDLIRTPETSPAAAVGAAIDAMRAPYRDIAVVTKMLHLKRPALVPVLDSLVLQQLGARGRSTVAIVTHAQAVGIANLPALEAIGAHLSAFHGDGGSPIGAIPCPHPRRFAVVDPPGVGALPATRQVAVDHRPARGHRVTAGPVEPGALERLTIPELWALWREALGQLQSRGVLRSTGGPVGDYAEWLVARAFGLARQSYPNPDYDVTAPDGTRYSVKARRWGRAARPTRVHVGRLDGDRFEYLVFVLLTDAMNVERAVRVPIAAVRSLVLRDGVNSTVGRLLGEPLAVDVTQELRAVRPDGPADP